MSCLGGPASISFDQCHNACTKAFFERYAMVLAERLGILPLGDGHEERPANLTPELRSRKHELTFEVTCVTRLEET